MAQVLVRNLSDNVKEYWRERAKRNGRSLEAEIRVLLTDEAVADDEEVGLGTFIARRSKGLGFDADDIRRIDALRDEPHPPHVTFE